MRRRDFVLQTPAVLAAAASAAETGKPSRIQRIDLIHHTHTDVGYTDMPSVCRDMQKRFIDCALDLCLADKRYRWTVESMLGMNDWWRATAEPRRNEFLRMVTEGQMDVMALPFNQTPFQNAMQWDVAVRWIPEKLWKAVRPKAAMQNDVNGLPRAGAMRLLDRGVSRVLMGINADSGGPPFRRPSAFWWKLPDGRKLFVWLGYHYGNAFSFFEPKRWIREQPKWAATEFRAPDAADVHGMDEQSLQAAHKHLLTQIAKLEAEGFDYPTLILSYTNQWRYDNDPPYAGLAAFVDAWNKLGLKPEVQLKTATAAVESMEQEIGGRAPVHEGEWTDWWANGDASGPREVAASRAAKRFLMAAASPVWGPMTERTKKAMNPMLRDLCLFDEHTWGANESVAKPYSLFTLSQYNEKSLLAYRPMGHAEALLGLCARTKLDAAGEGLHVVNTAGEPYTGWVRLQAAAFREEVGSLEGNGSKKHELVKDGGALRFWVDELPARGIVKLMPAKDQATDSSEGAGPAIEKDERDWPVSAIWPGMKAPLFKGELANFLTTEIIPPENRQTISKLHSEPDPEKRAEIRERTVRIVPAGYGRAEAKETAHTLVFTQAIEYWRIANAKRTVELWKRQARARVTVRFDRISSVDPEVMYAAFGFPVEGTMPQFSNGGVPFTPYHDQLVGSCRDYYAIDGWARYKTGGGEWLWVTRDAPLVTVGGPHTLKRRTDAPTDTHRMLAMLFDNCWHTNFVADSNGTMEFQFELVWRPEIGSPDVVAEALTAEPVVVLNGKGRQPAEMERNLFRL